MIITLPVIERNRRSAVPVEYGGEVYYAVVIRRGDYVEISAVYRLGFDAGSCWIEPKWRYIQRRSKDGVAVAELARKAYIELSGAPDKRRGRK